MYIKYFKKFYTYHSHSNIDRNFLSVPLLKTNYLKRTSLLSRLHGCAKVASFNTYYNTQLRKNSTIRSEVRKLSRVQRVISFSRRQPQPNYYRSVRSSNSRGRAAFHGAWQSDRSSRVHVASIDLLRARRFRERPHRCRRRLRRCLRNCPSWKVPPADRSGVSWNLLVTCCLKYTVTLFRNNVSRGFVDTACRERHGC